MIVILSGASCKFVLEKGDNLVGAGPRARPVGCRQEGVGERAGTGTRPYNLTSICRDALLTERRMTFIGLWLPQSCC